jgi:hypothetical protein
MPGKPSRVDLLLRRVCDVNPVYGVPAQEGHFKLRNSLEPVNDLCGATASHSVIQRGRRPVNGPDSGNEINKERVTPARKPGINAGPITG